jgi:hypothetical protein
VIISARDNSPAGQPVKPPTGVSEEEFATVPETLTVRVVEIHFSAKGFRSTSCLIVTTLLDTEIYTVESLGELYFQRWTVELHFRELKTFLGMEILRCRSPHMIKRELLMHTIAYNVIRHVMQSASLRNHKPLSRISFKGSLDTLRHWAPILDAARKSPPQTTPPPSGHATPHRRRHHSRTPRSIRTPRQKTQTQKFSTSHKTP